MSRSVSPKPWFEIQPVPLTPLSVDRVDAPRLDRQLETQLIWPSCSMISVTVPVQPPKEMSGKSGSIPPHSTRPCPTLETRGV